MPVHATNAAEKWVVAQPTWKDRFSVHFARWKDVPANAAMVNLLVAPAPPDRKDVVRRIRELDETNPCEPSRIQLLAYVSPFAEYPEFQFERLHHDAIFGILVSKCAATNSAAGTSATDGILTQWNVHMLPRGSDASDLYAVWAGFKREDLASLDKLRKHLRGTLAKFSTALRLCFSAPWRTRGGKFISEAPLIDLAGVAFLILPVGFVFLVKNSGLDVRSMAEWFRLVGWIAFCCGFFSFMSLVLRFWFGGSERSEVFDRQFGVSRYPNDGHLIEFRSYEVPLGVSATIAGHAEVSKASSKAVAGAHGLRKKLVAMVVAYKTKPWDALMADVRASRNSWCLTGEVQKRGVILRAENGNGLRAKIDTRDPRASAVPSRENGNGLRAKIDTARYAHLSLILPPIFYGTKLTRSEKRERERELRELCEGVAVARESQFAGVLARVAGWRRGAIVWWRPIAALFGTITLFALLLEVPPLVENVSVIQGHDVTFARDPDGDSVRSVRNFRPPHSTKVIQIAQQIDLTFWLNEAKVKTGCALLVRFKKEDSYRIVELRRGVYKLQAYREVDENGKPRSGWSAADDERTYDLGGDPETTNFGAQTDDSTPEVQIRVVYQRQFLGVALSSAILLETDARTVFSETNK